MFERILREINISLQKIEKRMLGIRQSIERLSKITYLHGSNLEEKEGK
ncbi:MAG: hypothetical protein QXP55_01600 [Nitrososphaerales archaeon]